MNQKIASQVHVSHNGYVIYLHMHANIKGIVDANTLNMPKIIMDMITARANEYYCKDVCAITALVHLN